MPPEEESGRTEKFGLIEVVLSLNGPQERGVLYSLPLVVCEGDSLGGNLEVDHGGGWRRVQVQGHSGGFLHRLSAG